ncbi:unnamed protein product, partial [Prorocentrum cordatum]
ADADGIAAPTMPAPDWRPGPPDLFHMSVERKPLEVLGLDVGNTAGNKTGAVILNLWENGLLNKWSANHPENPLKVGYIIVEVNKAHGFWEIFEQIGKVGVLNMVIQRNPPRQGWHDEVSHLGPCSGAAPPGRCACSARPPRATRRAWRRPRRP